MRESTGWSDGKEEEEWGRGIGGREEDKEDEAGEGAIVKKRSKRLPEGSSPQVLLVLE